MQSERAVLINSQLGASITLCFFSVQNFDTDSALGHSLIYTAHFYQRHLPPGLVSERLRNENEDKMKTHD